jgi:hypothetical protein
MTQVTTTGALEGFYQGVTFNFTVTCKIDDVAQDITSDTVTLTFKRRITDADTAAVIKKNADVATQGASGIAIFSLGPSDTNVPAMTYQVDIQWVLNGGAEYVLYRDEIPVYDRVSDP